MNTTSKLKASLYKKFCTGPHAKHNQQRIDFVINKIYKRQIKHFNWNEHQVLKRLYAHNIQPKVQQPIPILSQGGKLEHLYLADIVVGDVIIEVDGPQHKPEYDQKRDELTAAQGYKTIRIPTSDLSEETIDQYLNDLYLQFN